MIDISEYEVLEKYLLNKNVISKEEGYTIKYCSGGVSGSVAFVYAGKKPMIVKQALAQLKVKETWLCDPNRMNIEQESNRIYHDIMPTCTPEVYFYDSDNYIYCREAVPENCTMWKEDLMSGLLDYECARKVIEALLLVHEKCSINEKIKETFASKDIFYNLRISPYIEFVLKKYPELTDHAKPLVSALMDSEITLIHGDFSPKNIMINGREISILDFEVAHFGHPMFDLAFFCNHFILKAIKHKQWSDSFLNMLTYMMDIYFNGISYMDKVELETQFVKLLSLMMLARVDGKSPVEYLTEDSDKEFVRKCAFSMIKENITTYKNTVSIIKQELKEI